MKDYVFFIGPRKTGTTSFYEVLRQAKAPVSPTVKESFFFDQTTPDIGEYHARYSLDPNKPFVEISPSYFISVDAMENISSNFPNAKIIITLRHPLKRALSALAHAQRIGFLPQDWNDEVCANSKHTLNILNAGDYMRHIDLWAEKFPGRVCIIKQISNGKYDSADIKKVGDFIGVKIDPDIFYKTKANPAMKSRSPVVTGFARNIKLKLLNAGFFRTIQVLKRLAPLLHKRDTSAAPNEAAVEFFSNSLSKEISYFEAMPSLIIR